MANYAVFLEGNNFELARGTNKELLGFFVTVRVESPTEQEAANSAILFIKSAPQLEAAFQVGGITTPSIEVKVIHELLPENMMKNSEFVFFPMEEK
jgi:hypothetical protein